VSGSWNVENDTTDGQTGKEDKNELLLRGELNGEVAIWLWHPRRKLRGCYDATPPVKFRLKTKNSSLLGLYICRILAQFVSASPELIDGKLWRLQRHSAEPHKPSTMSANGRRQVVIQQTTQVQRVFRLRLHAPNVTDPVSGCMMFAEPFHVECFRAGNKTRTTSTG